RMARVLLWRLSPGLGRSPGRRWICHDARLRPESRGVISLGELTQDWGWFRRLRGADPPANRHPVAARLGRGGPSRTGRLTGGRVPPEGACESGVSAVLPGPSAPTILRRTGCRPPQYRGTCPATG